MIATTPRDAAATCATWREAIEPHTRRRGPSRGTIAPFNVSRAPPSAPQLLMYTLPAVGRPRRAAASSACVLVDARAAAYTAPSRVTAYSDTLPTATDRNSVAAALSESASAPSSATKRSRERRMQGKTHTSRLPSALTAAHMPLPAATAIVGSSAAEVPSASPLPSADEVADDEAPTRAPEAIAKSTRCGRSQSPTRASSCIRKAGVSERLVGTCHNAEAVVSKRWWEDRRRSNEIE